MKILLVHNFYTQPGGEDIVFEQECRMLRRKGHVVITYTRKNVETENISAIGQVKLLKTIVSAGDSRDDIVKILREETPDIVHIHNSFMMISPSIYSACAEAGVPTVQTLHNYRLLCPTVTFYRDGHVCEECVDHGLMRGVLHACYRHSYGATAAVALMLKTHRIRGTWTQKITAYIALTEFARNKFVTNGLPAEKIHIKPNFVDPDPGMRESVGEYALFVGRLSPEKGVSTLIEAWSLLSTGIPLKIAGDGPERGTLEEQVRNGDIKNIEFVGRLTNEDTRTLISRSAFLVLPSLWYEGFPMVLVESYACGVPVVGSSIGALRELIEDGKTGLQFTVGDPADLAHKVQWAFENPKAMEAMGRIARQKFEDQYGVEANYEMLMTIYRRAISEVSTSSSTISPE
jgi:glycosyltransferase involved in cell wall biosynthesis